MTSTNPAKKLLAVILAVCLLLTATPVAFAKNVKGNPGKVLFATASDVHYYPESLAK